MTGEYKICIGPVHVSWTGWAAHGCIVDSIRHINLKTPSHPSQMTLIVGLFIRRSVVRSPEFPLLLQVGVDRYRNS